MRVGGKLSIHLPTPLSIMYEWYNLVPSVRDAVTDRRMLMMLNDVFSPLALMLVVPVPIMLIVSDIMNTIVVMS